MVLKKLFGIKETGTASDNVDSKTEFDEAVAAVQGSIEEDAKIAETVSEKLEPSIDQKQMEAEDTGKE